MHGPAQASEALPPVLVIGPLPEHLVEILHVDALGAVPVEAPHNQSVGALPDAGGVTQQLGFGQSGDGLQRRQFGVGRLEARLPGKVEHAPFVFRHAVPLGERQFEDVLPPAAADWQRHAP